LKDVFDLTDEQAGSTLSRPHGQLAR